MARKFPSHKDIVRELVHLGSTTHLEQCEMAKYLRDFAQKWELGDVRRVKHPLGVPYGYQDPVPPTVVIEAGKGNEVVVLHGHYDRVLSEEWAQTNRNPVSLEPIDAEERYWQGSGCYDMLGGVTAILVAMRKMSVHKRRRVRAILVGREESQSEGTFAACDSDNNLFKDATCALTTEIAVGAKLGDPPSLIIGRPGRVGFNVRIHCPAMHAGSVTDDTLNHVASVLANAAENAVLHIPMSGHPRDRHSLMPKGRCLVPFRSGSPAPSSLSTGPTAEFYVNVFNVDSRLKVPDLKRIVQRAILDVIGEHLNEDDGRTCSVTEEPRAPIPFCEPWLEDRDGAFVRNVHAIGNAIAREREWGDMIVAAGGPVADELVISQELDIPVATIPVLGKDEHTPNETLDTRSVKHLLVPILRAAAAHPEPLAPRD